MDDLEEMLCKLEANEAPEINCRYPVLVKTMKSSPKGKKDDCKKCAGLRKQFEQNLLELESRVNEKFTELFELVSYLNAKIVHLEQNH